MMSRVMGALCSAALLALLAFPMDVDGQLQTSLATRGVSTASDTHDHVSSVPHVCQFAFRHAHRPSPARLVGQSSARVPNHASSTNVVVISYDSSHTNEA